MSASGVYVLIDDEFLVRRVWELMAEKHGADLRTFASGEDFLTVEAEIPRSARVYVDVQLADGKSGIELSREIAALGFKAIRLATGLPSDMVEKPAWVTEIVGKEPPWR